MKKKFMSDLEVDRAVKIQGTPFDRKRKLTNKEVRYAKKLHEQGFPITKIAKAFKVSWQTIKYNIDPEYRKYVLSKVSGVHTGNLNCGFADRVAYKRSLISK